MAASGRCRMPIRLPLGDFLYWRYPPGQIDAVKCAEVLGEASVRKFVAYTATAALGLKHSARCQLCKISLRGCGANPVQVRVLLICHSAHESPRSGIKKGVERLLLAYVEAGLPMMHPES